MQTEGDTSVRRAPTTRSKVTNNPRTSREIDGRTPEGRRRHDLIDNFVAALGGPAAISPGQMEKVVRCAELKALAETLRRRHLAGLETDLEQLIRVENLAARAEKALAIKAAPEHEGPTLQDYIATKKQVRRVSR